MTTWTEYPEFARLVRAMKALGWTPEHCQNADKTFGLDMYVVTDHKMQDAVEVQVRRYEGSSTISYGIPHRFRPTTVQAGIDVLVALEILPVEMRSVAASGCCAVDGPCRNGCEPDPLNDVLAYTASVAA